MLTLGSDQHAVIDLFEEARGLELNERLRSGERGRFTGRNCSPHSPNTRASAGTPR